MPTQSFHPFRSEQAKGEYEAVYAEMAKAWPVPFENLLIDTPSARTFARASGRPADPPLVLLSGTRGTSLMWAPMIAALAARHRTYALDTVNDVGLSVPQRDTWPPDALVDWLDEVFRVLVPKGTLDLMGMSYGGWLASLYALRFPQRVRKVVLLAPGGTVLRWSFGFFMRVMMILAIRVPGASEDTLRRVLRWVFEDAFRSNESRTYVEQDLTWMLKAGRYFVLPRMVWPTVLNDADWRRWSVPCLFLVGEHEKIYSPTAALKRLRRVAPLVKAEIVPGAGHDLTCVQPDLVARRVLEFLDEPVAPSSGGPDRAERQAVAAVCRALAEIGGDPPRSAGIIERRCPSGDAWASAPWPSLPCCSPSVSSHRIPCGERSNAGSARRSARSPGSSACTWSRSCCGPTSEGFSSADPATRC